MQERSTQDATVVLLAVMLLNLYSIGAVVRFSQHVGLTLAQSRCPWGCSSSCTWRQPRYSPFRPRASIIRNWAEVHCTGKPLNTEALGCQCFAGQAYFRSHSHVAVLRHCTRYMQAGHTGVCVLTGRTVGPLGFPTPPTRWWSEGCSHLASWSDSPAHQHHSRVHQHKPSHTSQHIDPARTARPWLCILRNNSDVQLTIVVTRCMW